MNGTSDTSTFRRIGRKKGFKVVNNKLYVFEAEDTYGTAKFTERHLNMIKDAANNVSQKRGQLGANRDLVYKKIRDITRWPPELSGIPLLCRFAYRHGICKL